MTIKREGGEENVGRNGRETERREKEVRRSERRGGRGGETRR